VSPHGWTTVDDITAKLRRRWEDGTLLAEHARAAPFEPTEVALRGPTAAQIGDNVAAVRDWIAELDSGRRHGTRYELEWKAVGGRKIGRNQLPARAVVRFRGQVWALLDVSGEVRRFDQLLESTAGHPRVRDWIVAHPHRALILSPQIPQLIAACEWFDGNRQSHRYLREISAPGVDTKFAERYRPELAAMLGVSPSAAGFVTDLGLRAKPALVRLRPAPSLGLPVSLTELAVRAPELAQLALHPRIAVIIENEISYLSAAVPEDGVVLWGKGFEVDHVGRLPWLSGAEIVYWGDIDTHGFAILHRLRAWLPATRSVLMDRETLLTHRDRWVIEERPAKSALTRLTGDEHRLYTDLVEGALGDRVRLEQERIDWGWAEQMLPAGH
jgi:hypothetical protein